MLAPSSAQSQAHASMALEGYRRLTLSLGGLVLISNLAALHVYAQLPEDPLHLTWHLSLYSYFAIALSVIGFFGARKDNATPVSIFSIFLLIDTILSAVPRVVAVVLFPSIRSSICSAENVHAWLEQQRQAGLAPLEAGATDPLYPSMIARCRNIVGVLQLLAGLVVLSVTLVQMLLSLRVSQYARALCRQEDELEERRAAIGAVAAAAAAAEDCRMNHWDEKKRPDTLV